MARQHHRLAPAPGEEAGVDLIAALSPYVRHCGDAWRPPWRIGTRHLLDHLLVHIAEGTGRFSIGTETWTAAADDLFWIPPDTPHSMSGDAPGMRLSYVHFDLVYRGAITHWDFSIPGGTTDLSPYGALLHPPVTDARLRACFGHIRGATNPRVGALIRTCSSEAARAQPFTGLRLSGLMLTIVAEILRGQAGEAQLRHEHLPLLEEAERYMAAHCHEDLRVSELADLAGLSPSHFRLLFAQHVGRSPREHLRHLRIERARQLLIGSDLSLTTVAHRCGFATVHSFSRAFRAVEGLAPSDWRRYGTVTTRVEGRTTPYPGA